MSIAEHLIQMLQQQEKLTRKVLERLPEDKWDYKPHPKSMPLGHLACHIVEMTGWSPSVLNMDAFDFDPAQYKPLEINSPAELVRANEEGTQKAIEALRGKPDEHMLALWKMTSGGKTFFESTRQNAIEDFVIHHTIHHRAQLGVYLRLLDIPVPSIYGPSADERG